MNINVSNLNLALARAEMNRRDLSKRCGVHESTLSKIYRGKSKPSPKLMGKIAKGLGVDVADLIERVI